MWALNFLPDIVFHIMLGVGFLGLIVGFVIKKIPFVENYRFGILVISIILTVLGVWYEGGIAKDKEYTNKIEKIENKIALANAETEKANAKLSEAIQENNTIRKEKANVRTKIITQIITKTDDSKCTLSTDFIMQHDAASQDDVPPSPSGTEGTPSEIKPSQLLETVTRNYDMCYKWRDQLLGWQLWYSTEQKNFDKIYQ